MSARLATILALALAVLGCNGSPAQTPVVPTPPSAEESAEQAAAEIEKNKLHYLQLGKDVCCRTLCVKPVSLRLERTKWAELHGHRQKTDDSQWIVLTLKLWIPADGQAYRPDVIANKCLDNMGNELTTISSNLADKNSVPGNEVVMWGSTTLIVAANPAADDVTGYVWTFSIRSTDYRDDGWMKLQFDFNADDIDRPE